VQELLHVVVALTATGQKDVNLINHTTPYYREVMAAFGEHGHENIVQQVDLLLREGEYATLKMNSTAFAFRGKAIVKNGPYNYLAWETHNNVDGLRAGLQAFAAKTRFRKFYAAHAAYYDSLKAHLTRVMPVGKIWQWCEREFPARYDSYRVTFSPLAHRSHSANRFADNGFAEAAIFISPARYFPGQNDQVTVGLNTRIIFTEMDHNYVNPVSETYASRIAEVFADRGRWVTDGLSGGYDTPLLVFNEYMTWAVFTLYCLEHFPAEDQATILRTTQEFMVEHRGFKNFPAFNAKLVELYGNRKNGQKISDLYDGLLAWSAAAR
jgi:hypothetical protein